MAIPVPCIVIEKDGEKEFKSIKDAFDYIGQWWKLSSYYVDNYKLFRGKYYIFRKSTVIDRSLLDFIPKPHEKGGNPKKVYMLRPNFSGRKFTSEKEAMEYLGKQQTNGTVCRWIGEKNKKLHCGAWWFSEEQMIQGKKDGSIERMVKEYQYHEQSEK